MTPVAFLVVDGPPPRTLRRLFGGAPRLFIFNRGSSASHGQKTIRNGNNVIPSSLFSSGFFSNS